MLQKGKVATALNFFHFHHEFRAGQAQQWWVKAQAAMSLCGGWDEAVAKNLEAGFFQPCVLSDWARGSAYCI
tara:strand:+ start:364 stop:579 length:216 start_codon:yes stop_codon:yes gene_type:complete